MQALNLNIDSAPLPPTKRRDVKAFLKDHPLETQTPSLPKIKKMSNSCSEFSNRKVPRLPFCAKDFFSNQDERRLFNGKK